MYAPRGVADKLRTGTVVTKIDGTDARQYLEQRSEAAWKEGGFFSSPQRARLFEYRLALRGEQGQTYTIHYLDGEEEKSLTVACETVVRGWPHTYNMPRNLKRVGRSFYYAKLGDDIGYMYLRRVDASAPEGIGEALGVHANLKGWVVDLRGNSGGGYDRKLIEQIKGFGRPVAVVIDAGCISAGETLARDFRVYAEARLFGSQSAGSSSSKRTWSFPSGIASLQFPVRSRWRHDRKPIEFNGIDPDVAVEVVPEEVRAGENSAILWAREYLAQEVARRGSRDTTR
jgi:C-terminal processing protease CtpA/Prc